MHKLNCSSTIDQKECDTSAPSGHQKEDADYF